MKERSVVPQCLLLLCLLYVFLGASLTAATWEVGPGKSLTSIGQVPWEILNPGDTVLIHYRTNAYAEKFVLCRQGTQSAPITIRGVPGPNGELPKLSGDNATTRTNLSYWGENRSVVKVGGANKPADTLPQFIVIENLDIMSARSPYVFTNASGVSTPYHSAASALWIEKGLNITVRNCALHDSSNGFFVSSSDTLASQNILAEGCYFYGNGNSNSIYGHNVYTAALGMTFQFNRFGPQRTDCLGNNLKDRSAGLVVRYNWIEGGSRQLDLVDAEDSSILRADPSYRTTYVYGNVLLEPNADGNSQILQYGGDSGNIPNYRKGKLLFYNNTVVSRRPAQTVLFHLSTNEEQCDARNNIFYVTNSGSAMALLDGAGILNFSYNWLKSGYANAFSAFTGAITNDGGNVTFTNSPGFVNETNNDFHLAQLSSAINVGGAVSVPLANACVFEYVKHQSGVGRLTNGIVDLGAFEFNSPLQIWRLSQFGTNATTAAIAGDTADPDGDGKNNLTEYAFGQNPLVATTNRLSQGGIFSTNSSNYLTIAFTTRSVPSGLKYVVQTSSNLLTWQNGVTFSDTTNVLNTAETRDMSGAGATNKVIQTVSPVNVPPAKYMRVKAELN